jgi:riboflavin synthase
MFTGIIRYQGQVESLQESVGGTHLVLATPLATEVNAGDSLAVNGACLTVLQHTAQTITFRLMQETLQRTNLGQLKPKSPVNLERPLTPTQSIDGHFVMGHIDGLATITAISTVKHDKIFTCRLPSGLLRYLIPKGSIALDGVSLTLVDINQDSFTVSLMPYTLEHTLFGQVSANYQTNIEVDLLGKYVERFISHRPGN